VSTIRHATAPTSAADKGDEFALPHGSLRLSLSQR
jgi:hypothetical protein